MVNKRNKWCLSTGCIGRDMTYVLISLFLLTYIQYTGLVDAAQFLVLSIIIVACHVWDAVNDPMMGTIISNTYTRFGKYRPWVLIGAISNSVVLVLLFCVRFDNGWANVAFIGTMYLLWGMTYTMNDIAYWDIVPALTKQKKERDSLLTLVAVFASVGQFISGGLIPVLTPGNMVTAYRYISIVCAVVFLGCQLMVFFCVHDNKEDKFRTATVQKDENEEEKITLKDMLHILLSNKQLVVMTAVVLLNALSSALLNAFGQNFFYFKFGYLSSDSNPLGGGTMMTIFTAIYAVGTLISQAIYPALANRYKRSQLVKISIIMAMIGYGSFFLFANLLSGMTCFIALCIFGVFIFAGQGVFYLVMLVMLTNTIEYDEWQTGKNHSAITFTIRPFMTKLAGAIQYGIVALTLVVCGLYAITSNVGNVEVAIGMLREGAPIENAVTYLGEMGHDTAAVLPYLEQGLATKSGNILEGNIAGLQMYTNQFFHAEPGSMLGLTFTMSVIPIFLYLLTWILIKKKYIITEELFEKILSDLSERKGKKEND